jgi:hypothetical protein
MALSGVYNGLFSTSNRLHASSGFFSLALSDRATYSVSMVWNGRTNSLTGIFDRNGYSVNTVGADQVTVALALNLTNGANQMLGTVSNAGWVASLQADLSVFDAKNPCPYQGKYTLVIPVENTSNAPAGFGYGTVSVDANGTVILNGCLGDGAPLGQSAKVSQDGRWPFYASLYGGKGSAYGWLYLTNTPTAGLPGGDVNWIKPALAAAAYYPNGFVIDSAVPISPYNPPVSTNRVIAMTNGTASFSGGNLASPLTKKLILTLPSNHFASDATNQLTLSLTTGTGFFSGTVADPAARTNIAFKGVLLQDQSAGYGYFPGSNKTGSVILSPAP